MLYSKLIFIIYYLSAPQDNPFYSNIDSMPDIRPRRKSIPLVSDLVVIYNIIYYFLILIIHFIFWILSQWLYKGVEGN